MRRLFIIFILTLTLFTGCYSTSTSTSNSNDIQIIVTQLDFKYDSEIQKVTLIGEAKNVGTKTDTIHPWHGIQLSCYDENGKLLDTTGVTVDILNPNEIGSFKTYMFGIQKPYECKAKVLY